VINPCRDLEKAGATVCMLPVDAEGRVDPGMLRAALTPDTTLVSIAAANPEIGTVQPLKELGRVARAAGVPFHVDAVGALGRVPLNVEGMGIDLLTTSTARPAAGRSGSARGCGSIPRCWEAARRAATAPGPRTCPASWASGWRRS
jgi:cysteine desulfurase